MNLKVIVRLLVLLCGMMVLADGSRILAFIPFPGKSHQRVYQPLLRALAEKGHEVTVVTPLPIDDPPPNYSQVVVVNVMEDLREKMGIKGGNVAQFRGGLFSTLMAALMRKMGILMTEAILTDPAVKRLIDSDLEYDALILETAFLQEAFIGLQHRFNAVTIDVLPAGNFHWAYYIYGNPYDSSYIVDFSLPFTDRMSFTERLQNTLNSIFYRTVWSLYFMPKYQKIMDDNLRYKGWESRPPLMDMVRNTSLVLVNSDVALNYPYPMAAHFKEVGGINIVPTKPLPKDIQEFMDSAKDGVIYFTLGSHIQVSEAMGKLKDELSKAFGKLKQKVLWKWETDFPDPPKNVKISNWFPQQDILAHKNIRLFITHGGFLSLSEAVYHAVPLVGIPLLGDQTKNVVHMTNYGYGLYLDLENTTESSLSWAINEVLDNPKYKENIKERSRLLRDKPRSPAEEAVYWVEYVIRHKGASHLRPAVLDLTWWQHSLLDVYAAVTLIVVVSLYLTVKVVSCCVRRVCRCFCSKKDQTKTKDAKKKVKKN